ncbi:LysR family transcriptional regulator [Acidisoma sp. 7E03]
MINIPTNLLRALIMVIDLKGVTKASEGLGRTQPTISLQIKKLQEMIGVTLLERETGVAQLTEAGEVCVDYARRILALHDEMMSRLATHGAGNRLRIGVPNDYADHFLPKFLTLVDADGLDVRFEVVSDISQNLLRDMRNGTLDIVVAMTDQLLNGAVISWPESLSWVGAPGRVPPAGGDAGRPFPLVAAPEGCLYRRLMLSVLQHEGQSADVVYTTASLTGIEAAVRSGFGVTAMATRLVPPSLVPVTDLPPLPSVQVGVYLTPRAQGRPVRRLAALLGQVMAEVEG